MKGREKRDVPEKTRRPAAFSGTIPTCENPGATRPGIEPGSPWWEARTLSCFKALNAQSNSIHLEVWHALPPCNGCERCVFPASFAPRHGVARAHPPVWTPPLPHRALRRAPCSLRRPASPPPPPATPPPGLEPVRRPRSSSGPYAAPAVAPAIRRPPLAPRHIGKRPQHQYDVAPFRAYVCERDRKRHIQRESERERERERECVCVERGMSGEIRLVLPPVKSTMNHNFTAAPKNTAAIEVKCGINAVHVNRIPSPGKDNKCLPARRAAQDDLMNSIRNVDALLLLKMPSCLNSTSSVYTTMADKFGILMRCCENRLGQTEIDDDKHVCCLQYYGTSVTCPVVKPG
ncbi:hypothetical protein PR048_010443 [Dryococelus australis]|uniref:Uncharacterized protein n=1 Tax=Dryococelus australis TaxID=614101 RepID=A0ABQ9I3V2_9NEOP|nr:hypothetical protein PR048_010443 [Dryococelus australis]